jgi:hypothetical protein
VTTGAVAAALESFDGAWEALPTAERCRLPALLIERVTYDGDNLAITFRPNGFAEATHEHASHH